MLAVSTRQLGESIVDTTELDDLHLPAYITEEQDAPQFLTPEFIEELRFLNIAVDEYERLLQDGEPNVITTSNTAGY